MGKLQNQILTKKELYSNSNCEAQNNPSTCRIPERRDSILFQVTTGIFFICYLAAPRPPLGHYHGCSPTRPMVITCVFRIRPEGHRGPCSVVGSLSPAGCLVGFEARTFRFWSQRLNPLGHSGKWIRWIMWIVILPKIYPQEWNLHKLLLNFWKKAKFKIGQNYLAMAKVSKKFPYIK